MEEVYRASLRGISEHSRQYPSFEGFVLLLTSYVRT
jgi:hypothetical protein